MSIEFVLLSFLGVALIAAAIATKLPYKTSFSRGSAKFIFHFGQVLFIGIVLLVMMFDAYGIYNHGGLWPIIATGLIVESIRNFVKA